MRPSYCDSDNERLRIRYARRFLKYGWISATWVLLCFAEPARAQLPPDHHPAICTGYSEDAKTWIATGSSHALKETHCPRGHAFYATVLYQKSGITLDPEKVKVAGNCCPLPAADMLTDQATETSLECPPDAIVTGARLNETPAECSSEPVSAECVRESYLRKTMLRCTKINTARYRLQEVQQVLTVGLVGHLRYLFQQRTQRKNIPPAIRRGVGRLGRLDLSDTACIGYPWGAVFTGRFGKPCSKAKFRQFEFTGLPGDPPLGTPVQMFPICDALSEPLSPHPECKQY